MTMRILLSLSIACLLFSCASEPPVPAPKPPDEAAAIAALKEINAAQTNFIRRKRRYAQTFDELIAEYLLVAEPKKADTGYDFLILLDPEGISYRVKVTPTTPTGRHFFTNQTGVIRAEAGKPATIDSPEI